MKKLSLGSRILGFLIGLGLEVLTYHLIRFWWDVYNKVYSEITPLLKSLSEWALVGGVITGFLGLIFLSVSIKGK